MISYNTLFLLFLAAFLMGLWAGLSIALCLLNNKQKSLDTVETGAEA